MSQGGPEIARLDPTQEAEVLNELVMVRPEEVVEGAERILEDAAEVFDKTSEDIEEAVTPELKEKLKGEEVKKVLGHEELNIHVPAKTI